MKQRSLATARALFAGVIISFLLLAGGLLAYFYRQAEWAGTLLHSGLIALVATPLLRIMVLGFEFIRRREYAFLMMAIGVLLLLGLSVVIGVSLR